MGMMGEKEFFTISEVSKSLHIPKHTIRFWERVCPEIFAPQRTKGGQRRFSRKDIFRIEEIKAMREKGIGLFEIKRMLTQEGRLRLNQIDLLAQRVAEIIKAEFGGQYELGCDLSNFFEHRHEAMAKNPPEGSRGQ